jgi:small subunit ribosomal protein S21
LFEVEQSQLVKRTWRDAGSFFLPVEGKHVIEIMLAETDRLEWALKQFRRRMLRSGRFKDMKRKRFYVKPSEARKAKEKAASRRRSRERRRAERGDGF